MNQNSMLGPLYQSLVPIQKKKCRYCSKKNRKSNKDMKSASKWSKIEEKSKNIIRKEI